MKRTMLRRLLGPGVAAALAPLLLAPLGVVAPAVAADAPSDTLAGTVYLPDGFTPAPAAIVDLMRADPAGQPIPGSAFARGVADLDGRFSVNPRERDDLVAAAQAHGGDLSVAVQIGKLAPHGSLDPAAVPGSTVPDVAFAVKPAVLRLKPVEAPDDPSATTFVFVFVPPVSNPLLPRVEGIAGPAVEVVLTLADTALRAANVLGMVTDPDLVTGNDDLGDPDLIPPLGAIMSELATVPESEAAGPERVGGVGVQIGPGGVALPTPENDSGNGTCGKDPGTQWVSSRHGNNIEGTKTYVYLDTFSCTKDTDPDRDEVIYKWGGYTGSANKHWTIYRLKYRTQVRRPGQRLHEVPRPGR